MSLTWHIVRKDLRRMALPVAAWVGFVVVMAAWFSLAHMPEASVAARELDRWIWGLGAFSAWTMGMQVITTVLLAGHLMLEDPVVGTTAFWQTRPIGRGRMLAAKLLAGGLLLVVAPAVALGPVWLANGFSAGEAAGAAGEFAAWQATLLVPALAFATMTRSLAQFFFASVGVAVAYFFATMPAMGTWWGRELGVDVERSRQMLTFLAPAPGMALVLLFQSLTRRTRDAWILVGVGLVAIHAVRVSWPFNIMPLLPTPRARVAPVAAASGEPRGGVAVQKIVTPFDRALPHAVFMTVGEGPVREGFFAPERGTVQLRLPDGRRAQLSLDHGGFWGQEAAKRIAGLVRDEGAIEWGMAARVSGVHALETYGQAPELTGAWQLAWMRGRVLAELPWRTAAEARNGSSALRIVGLGGGVNYDRPCVVVEERDAVFVRDVGLTGGREARRADATRRDVYLLVNRALGIFKCLHIVELGSVNANSLLVSTRQLEFSNPETVVGGQRVELPGWREGAVLIKVRFELERRVMRDIAGGPVALVAEEERK